MVTMDPTLQKILIEAVSRSASDVHLIPDFPAAFRRQGALQQSAEQRLISADIRRMIESIIPEARRGNWHHQKDLDFSLAFVHDQATHRFRANVFLSRGAWCACLRYIPQSAPSFEWMGFPEPLAQRMIGHRNGLVITTGVSGSGKSTTLAALIHLLNTQGGVRIITVEDPIEFVHSPHGTSIVTQREVGRDVESFHDGLKFGLRQDPDVMLVGEIRDRETASMALSAAETGHLILASMHTKDAKGAVTRFVDLFPSSAQDDVRTQLSLSLRAVVCQHLLPPKNPQRQRVLALEVMHLNNPVRSAIRFGKIDNIESAIQTGKRDGMITLDEDLVRLLHEGTISLETAKRFAKDIEAFTG